MSAQLETAREPTIPEVFTECVKFWWIGQGFDTCDNCAEPYWEHRYEAAVGGQEPEEVILVQYPWSSEPTCEPVMRITAERAEACRRKWEGYTARMVARGWSL